MKYLFVLAFVLVFVFFDKSIGYTKTSDLWTHATYMFQHAGIIHLSVNSLAFISMFRVLEKYVNAWSLSLAVLSIGFFVSFLSAYDIPTVGCSSCVYAMVGIFFSLIFSGRLYIRNRKEFLTFIVLLACCFAVSFFKSNSNFPVHVFSLSLGFTVVFLLNSKFIKSMRPTNRPRPNIK